MSEFNEAEQSLDGVAMEEERVIEKSVKTPTEALVQLRALKNNWHDDPNEYLSRAEQEFNDDPRAQENYDRKSNNERRVAWFESVGSWAVWVAYDLLQGPTAAELTRRGNALLEKVDQERKNLIPTTDEDITAGEKLLADTIAALEDAERKANETSA